MFMMTCFVCFVWTGSHYVAQATFTLVFLQDYPLSLLLLCKYSIFIKLLFTELFFYCLWLFIPESITIVVDFLHLLLKRALPSILFSSTLGIIDQ